MAATGSFLRDTTMYEYDDLEFDDFSGSAALAPRFEPDGGFGAYPLGFAAMALSPAWMTGIALGGGALLAFQPAMKLLKKEASFNTLDTRQKWMLLGGAALAGYGVYNWWSSQNSFGYGF